MVHYCCAGEYYNNSDSTMEGLSWHGFPEDKKLIKVNMCYLIARSCERFVLRICNLIHFLYRCGSRVLNGTRRKILRPRNTQNFVQTTFEKEIS